MIRTRAVPVMVPRGGGDLRRLFDRGDGDPVASLERALHASGLAPNARVAGRGRDALGALLSRCTDRRGEVIVPAYTDASVYDAVVLAGHRPVLADVRADDGNLDPDGLPISNDTVAVIATHLYGHPADLDVLIERAASSRIAVIEDAAHALGARFGDARVGSFGAGAFTSFAPFKIVQAHGGGVAWSKDPNVARTLAAALAREPARANVTKALSHAMLGALTRTPAYDAITHPIARAATDARLDPKRLYKRWIRPALKRGADDARPGFSAYQARLALAQLDGLDDRAARRRAHADRVREACGDVARFTAARPGRTSAELMLAVYASDPARAIAHLHRRGVGALRSPMSDLFARERGGGTSVSAWIAAHAVLLPCDAELAPAHTARVIDAVRAAKHEWVRP
ncbi:MAG: DegT/DnrJ/EryC1/StrS family aminotransferase [Sandaracinaceae bacterium]